MTTENTLAVFDGTLFLYKENGGQTFLFTVFSLPFQQQFNVDFNTLSPQVSQKYRTVSDGHLLEYPDHGITFSVDQNTCGIVFDALNPELHDGSWKCQVSDTDNDSHQIKVEANTTLHVAQKASK